jgi:antagonist of KipI
MSLKILKAGVLDTIQDMGRSGYQHLGINPAGAMDKYAAAMANVLAGNKMNEAVIEIHFPGPVILFEEPALIALCGADFNATVGGEPVPVCQPLLINKNSVLQFHSPKNKSRCYLSVHGGIRLNKWLNSASTHLKAEAGGLHGKKLIKGDVMELNLPFSSSAKTGTNDFRILPWKASEVFDPSMADDELLVLQGSEWDWMDEDSKNKFSNNFFTLTAQSDRMGYRLTGEPLHSNRKQELVSSPVCFGTIQLLPDGQLIILVADHQTTGGYPRIGTVISACHSRLAQMQTGDKIHFKFVNQQTAENLFLKQQRHLLQLEIACKLRLENIIHEINRP